MGRSSCPEFEAQDTSTLRPNLGHPTYTVRDLNPAVERAYENPTTGQSLAISPSSYGWRSFYSTHQYAGTLSRALLS